MIHIDLTAAEQDLLACRCHDGLCPLHNEASDGVVEVAVEDLIATVERIIAARMRCGAKHPDSETNPSLLACTLHRDDHSDGLHWSSTGCAGSALSWPVTPSTDQAALDRLRSLSDQATPGVWRQEFFRDGELLADGTGGHDEYETPGSGVYVIDETSPEGYALTEFDAGTSRDAALIVAAVNAVRSMLDADGADSAQAT